MPEGYEKITETDETDNGMNIIQRVVTMKPEGQPGLEITDNVARQVDDKGKPKIEYDRF